MIATEATGSEELIYLEGFEAFAGTVDEVGGAPVLRRIQILPRGIANIRDGRKMKVEQADIDSVMKMAEQWPNEIAFLVQHGEDPKYGNEAMGWIKKLEEDAKGVYAYVEWLAEGALLIRGKKFKYVSPGLKFKRDAEGFMRPLYVQEASITNTAAVGGMDQLAASEQANETLARLTTLEVAVAGLQKSDKESKEGLSDMTKPVTPDTETPGEALDQEDTTENCSDCKQPFKGKHTKMCEHKGKGMSENKEKENQMDEKTIAALAEMKAEFDKKLADAIAGIDVAKLAETIEAKLLPILSESAGKSADVKLAEQRKEDAFTAVLDGATKEGRLTAAQRENFMELVGGNHNPESAAKFIATLPVTAPVTELNKNVPDPNITETTKEETRAQFMDRCVKHADKYGCSIVAAETALLSEKK